MVAGSGLEQSCSGRILCAMVWTLSSSDTYMGESGYCPKGCGHHSCSWCWCTQVPCSGFFVVTLAMTNFESNFEVLIVDWQRYSALKLTGLVVCLCYPSSQWYHVSTKMMVMSEGHNLVFFDCKLPRLYMIYATLLTMFLSRCPFSFSFLISIHCMEPYDCFLILHKKSLPTSMAVHCIWTGQSEDIMVYIVSLFTNT